jgi:hypothetical protein
MSANATVHCWMKMNVGMDLGLAGKAQEVGL